jgi:hypothetical protein
MSKWFPLTYCGRLFADEHSNDPRLAKATAQADDASRLSLRLNIDRARLSLRLNVDDARLLSHSPGDELESLHASAATLQRKALRTVRRTTSAVNPKTRCELNE